MTELSCKHIPFCGLSYFSVWQFKICIWLGHFSGFKALDLTWTLQSMHEVVWLILCCCNSGNIICSTVQPCKRSHPGQADSPEFVLPQFWCSFDGSFLWEEVQILFRVINGRCRCNWHQYFLFFFFLRNSFLSFCLYFFYFALTEVLVYEYIFWNKYI